MRAIKRALRGAGFKYNDVTEPGRRGELWIERYDPGSRQRIQGFIGVPNKLYHPGPGRTPAHYLILCDDWDRRANARLRWLWESDEDVPTLLALAIQELSSPATPSPFPPYWREF